MLARDQSRDTSPSQASSESSIEALVAQAVHLLPEQAPLHAFVHHNTLHAFEDLMFDDAVLEASRKLGTETYVPQSFFAKQLDSGRITPADIRRVVEQELGEEGEVAVTGGLSRAEFRVLRLQRLVELPRGSLLRFCIDEREATSTLHAGVSEARRAQLRSAGVEAATLKRLWRVLKDEAPPKPADPIGARRRDQLLQRTGHDTDEVVHPLLIRLCGAFLDQGVAYWRMPSKGRGFLEAVRTLYALPLPPPDRLFRGLADTLRDHASRALNAEQTIRWALEELEVDTNRYGAYIEEALVALRGWAGMMYRFETRPDQAPVEASSATLMDYLAVRLVLEAIAAKNVLALTAGHNVRLRSLDHPTEESPPSTRDLELAYESFLLAQHLPVDLSAIERDPGAWILEVSGFGDLERRRYLQLAFERHHHQQVLRGLRARAQNKRHAATRTTFQAAFCIDDREESTRRHLEEACAEVETFGYPGFYGVAMEYKSAEAHKGRPLCPASMRADHAITERATHQPRQPLLAQLRLGYHVGRVSLFRGALISMFGVLAMVPWLAATLFRKRLGSFGNRDETNTTIAYRRDQCEEHPQGNGLPEGYTVEEMVGIVGQFLTHTGLSAPGRLADLVVLCGHGSTSINNPHLAAYGCGATGGGCGGPNARVFAMMANDPEVRAELAKKQIEIPDCCHFMGALHDTCQDKIVWYDEHDVPAALAEALATAKTAFRNAMQTNAVERCRLFGTVPLGIKPEHASREVSVRARDLSEARPEYNHAKNSLCIVGPRQLTRGLFLDQRAFLVSYDESLDPDGSLLAQVLTGSLPVSVGINLEYYFSSVDPIRYGAGSKLPHNITGLVGVMDGHASDLRTGLYEQMVEIHEPMRLLAIVLAAPKRVCRALELSPDLNKLVRNQWYYLLCYDAQTDTFHDVDGALVELDEDVRASAGVAASSLELCRTTRQPVTPSLIED